MTTLSRRDLARLTGVGYAYDGSGYGESAYDGNARGFIPAGGGYADDEGYVGADFFDVSANFLNQRITQFGAKVDASSKKGTPEFQTFNGPFTNHRMQWGAWFAAHVDSATHTDLAVAELSIFEGKQGIFEQEFAALPNVTLPTTVITGSKPKPSAGGGGVSQPQSQPTLAAPATFPEPRAAGIAPDTLMKAGAAVAVLGALALAFSGGKGSRRR
jgi:hypothetical protein